jgi:hypothetical protein
MEKPRIILITRTWNDEKIKDFLEKIINDLYKVIVLVNCEKEPPNYTENLLKKLKPEVFDKIAIIPVKPWGEASGALNVGLTRVFEYKPDQILIASKEVMLSADEINNMSQKLLDDNTRLVVGYALKACSEKGENFDDLSRAEKGHYQESSSLVLKTPWNTCAIWNTDLFRKHVRSFNIICDSPWYLDEVKGKLQGMEDALAMALAVKENKNLKIGLFRCPLNWLVRDKEKHKEKMIRKVDVYDKYSKMFDLPNLENNLESF